MLRDIIEIDEELCVGCGECVPNCHQGALQIIDGKVRLLSDLMCEGLGACVGHCPTGAMTISKREAQPYDEALVMEKMIAGGPNVVKAHLEHLRQHAQDAYLAQALTILSEKGIENPMKDLNETKTGPKPISIHQPATDGHGHHGNHEHSHGGGGCPGSRAMSFAPKTPVQGGIDVSAMVSATSELRQWPVQLHLLSPQAPYLKGADLLLAADCTAFAAGGFHSTFLKGKALAIACPKLDDGQDNYVNKLTAMIDSAGLNTLTVLIMEVPCCRGLVQIAQNAVANASRKVPIKMIVLGLDGEVRSETWI